MQPPNHPYPHAGNGHQYIAPALPMHISSSANHHHSLSTNHSTQLPSNLLLGPCHTPLMMIPAHSDASGRSKRKQVKNACVNCQKACKKCDDGRACQRCIKLGLIATCVDSPRKERRKGMKRGPYKKRSKQNDDEWDDADYSKSQWPEVATMKPAMSETSSQGHVALHRWEQPQLSSSAGKSFAFQNMLSIDDAQSFRAMSGYRPVFSDMESPPLSSTSDHSDTYATSATTSLSSSPNTYFRPTINHPGLEANSASSSTAAGFPSDTYNTAMLINPNELPAVATTVTSVYHPAHSPTSYPSSFSAVYEPVLSQPGYSQVVFPTSGYRPTVRE